MLKYGREYVKANLADYEAKLREQMERSLKRKASQLGFALVPKVPDVVPATTG